MLHFLVSFLQITQRYGLLHRILKFQHQQAMSTDVTKSAEIDFFGKNEILANFEVDFKGEGVRKSKNVKGSFLLA